MRIKDNHLKSSTNSVITGAILAAWSKSEKTNSSTVDILNRKDFTVTVDINEYIEKDLFKEHLMLNIW
ncbi:hypothetical protein P8V03_18250 [Clostridium sp. A1-XYC3]|uniref:Uncharacterized protein n=1 Tax=Clostridium tanneri TaxID=3037988 RepID=A0ABU4JYA1_9CLOT|nr:hypothetical protein [Clostridium sp. A1-XYC3]MDW8803082.1 hypothetical protein [Clostridium sp. A1-XYC3]